MPESLVRTRMAPSPTGDLHIGSLRTFLYSYAFAKKNNGQFLLRIEDTDQKRQVAGAADRLQKVMKDFGLSWDGEPVVQSERLDLYRKYVRQLLDQDHAYYCFCTQERLDKIRNDAKAKKRIPKYDRHCLNLSPTEIAQNLKDGLPYVIRMRIPDNETVSFNDLIRGPITFNTADLDDQVLIKSNGIPTYHFAVVVDDHLMEISHIIRADEWISSTPKHILLYKYFGWTAPQIAHLTVLLDPSHPGKMSKRFGSVFAQQFLDEGYLPEAMLNFLMLLGWNPGTDREVFTLEEFVKEFSLEHLHKKAAIFDRKKLDYFNGLYIRQLNDDKLFSYFKKFLSKASDDQIKILIPILKDRIVKFSDLPATLKFIFEDIDYDPSLLLQRDATKELVIDMLSQTKDVLINFSDIQNKLTDLIKKNSWNTGQYFMVLRVAICGATFTPPVVECLPALGCQNTLGKIDLALAKLK